MCSRRTQHARTRFQLHIDLHIARPSSFAEDPRHRREVEAEQRAMMEHMHETLRLKLQDTLSHPRVSLQVALSGEASGGDPLRSVKDLLPPPWTAEATVVDRVYVSPRFTEHLTPLGATRLTANETSRLTPEAMRKMAPECLAVLTPGAREQCSSARGSAAPCMVGGSLGLSRWLWVGISLEGGHAMLW